MNSRTARGFKKGLVWKVDFSCIVLAGGTSSRLRRNKLSERIGDESLIQRVISRLRVFGGEIIVVKSSDSFPAIHSDCPKLTEVRDVYAAKGPLGGIYTGLAASNTYHNLVVAGDMPFLNQRLLAKLIELARGHDIAMPRPGLFVEPLHAVYTSRCLAPIRYLIEHGELSVLKLLPLVDVRYVGAEIIDGIDSGHRSFFNINTEAELRTARELLRASFRPRAKKQAPA